MAHRIAAAHFETYAQARLAFVRSVAEMADRMEYLEPLASQDVFTMLKTLIKDKVTTVAATAALAIGRMAGYSVELSLEVVKAGLLDDLVASMPGAHASHLKAGAFVFKSVAKHTADLCQCTIEAGCLGTLVNCMEQLDVTVREAAATALAVLASHNGAQAQTVAEAGPLPLLVAAMKEPEAALKRAAASALGEIAHHTEELAAAVVACDAVPVLVNLLKHPEMKVRRQAAHTLSNIVKHTPTLADAAAAAGIFPMVFPGLQDADSGVRRNAATLIRDVVKHSEALARTAVSTGAIPCVMEYMTTRARGADRLPATVALGFIASYAESLAQTVLDAMGAAALKDALLEDAEDHSKAAAVWALGQVGKHTPTHARALAEADVLRHVLAAMLSETSSEDLKEKSKRSLKAVLGQCDHVMCMQALLPEAPPNIALILLRQIADVLRSSVEERRNFVASGALKMIQTLEAANPDMTDLVESINAAFPAEVVAYCKPDFIAKMASKAV